MQHGFTICNMEQKKIVGVDIGGTQIKFGLFSSDGALLDKWLVATDLRDNGAKIIPSIAESIRAYFKAHAMAEADLAGIGIGVPGPIDADGHVIKCVNLHWYHFEPAKALTAYFPDCRIAAGNDANLAALGEYYCGAAKSYRSVMLITLGTGVGGGIVLDGKVVCGAHGNAGEIGHVRVDLTETEHCNCGNCGCVDQNASATGIVRNMKRLLVATQEPSVLRAIAPEKLTARDVCDAARNGDKLAKRCIDHSMGLLATAMAAFSHAFEPEIFLIGGGVSAAADVLIPAIQAAYEKQLFLIEQGAELAPAALGNDAGMIGAYHLIRNEIAKHESSI